MALNMVQYQSCIDFEIHFDRLRHFALQKWCKAKPKDEGFGFWDSMFVALDNICFTIKSYIKENYDHTRKNTID